MSEAKGLNIRTGLKAYRPYTHTDDVIWVDFGNPNIAVKIAQMQTDVSEAIGKLGENEADTLEAIEALNALFSKQMNSVFGAGVSEVLFKDLSPLSFDGERFLIQAVLEAFEAEITNTLKRKIGRHTKKYEDRRKNK